MPTPTPTPIPFSEIGRDYLYRSIDETAVSLHSLSLDCALLECELSYLGLLANQTSDFTPIPQGAFVGLLSDGGYVTRPAVGETLCDVLDSCGAVKTTMAISGSFSYSRDNPVTYVGWVSSEICAVKSRDGTTNCSSEPTANESQYIWSAPMAPTSADCDALFGENKLNEMIDGMCGFDARDFSGHSLVGLDLTGMQAPGASFVDADLSNAILDGANLIGADFTGATLSDSSFVGADMSSSILTDAVARRTVFLRTEMTAAKLSGGQFVEADFTEADMDELVCNSTDFRFTTLMETSFRQAKCANAVFIGASVISSDFSDSILDGADFRNATVKATDFDGVNLGEVLGLE